MRKTSLVHHRGGRCKLLPLSVLVCIGIVAFSSDDKAGEYIPQVSCLHLEAQDTTQILTDTISDRAVLHRLIEAIVP
jgi:hypothetical protein